MIAPIEPRLHTQSAPARQGQPLLKIDAVDKTFERAGKTTEVLKNVSLTIENGEFVAIIGHSGCGKSTLLNLIAGLTRVSAGAVLLEDREVNSPGPDRAVVFQNHSLLPWLSVYDNVRLAVDKVFGSVKSRAERHEWTLHNLELVQMGHARDKRPGEISGGMKQRVGIARALAMEPKVLLMDEPFGALDALTRAHLQDSVMQIHARLGNTVVMITHDIDEAVLLSDRIVMMTNGPAARIGEVLDVDLPRPRNRLEMVSDKTYIGCREAVMKFLYDRQLRGGGGMMDTLEPALATQTDAVGAPRAPARKQKLVVIGNGMAPGRALERLFETAPAGSFDVTIFNAEPRVNYDRIMLSPVLSGEKSYEEIVIHGDGWYVKHGVTLYKGHKVVAIDRARKTVTSAPGITVAYDKLLIATGSVPVVIPVPGKALAGVLTYRDLDDVQAMLLAAKSRGRAVVIGGGLLGLEAAVGLKEQGMDVTVVHLMPTLMERQLDVPAGHLLQKAIEARGIKVLTKANTKAILGDKRVEALELEDGTRIPCELVVMAVGIRPNAQLAKDAGLEVKRGIVVDAGMHTSDPDVLAVGECVEAHGQVFGLVAPLYEMANVVAAQLSGDTSATFAPSAVATKLKVTGINLFSAGDFADGRDRDEIVLRDAARGVYKRLVLKDDRLIGVVLYGETTDGAWFFDLLRKGTSIAELRETLIFGPSYAIGAQLDPTAAVAALPDEAEICGCNGICKGRITSAITAQGLTTLDDVRAHTKASASCGSCTGLVEQLLKVTLGDAYNPAAVQPMCGCTGLGHDDVRRLIVAKRLKSIPETMQALEWKTSCGCAKCRPALNYYLLATWPGEYVDDSQSRFINERVHANIQKDGTYSVVPRMWGGLTSAKELRAIADVVEKFKIPTVKVTGGQRIDMLGVRKEDLPAVWSDLNAAGMVSGAAYAKGLRTVKTCVGSEWCRFGTQDSTGLGVKIEKFMWGSWTPAKVKMAVSGCPRNCAEATCKDVGVICVESGYDIHFAGAAGLDIKGTELLGHVDTEDEAIVVIAALVQLYREQGRYLERIYKWAKRVGVDTIRAQVLDDHDRRRALYDRFVVSQRYAQIDPWAERVAGKDAHEFRPMADLSLREAAE